MPIIIIIIVIIIIIIIIIIIVIILMIQFEKVECDLFAEHIDYVEDVCRLIRSSPMQRTAAFLYFALTIVCFNSLK